MTGKAIVGYRVKYYKKGTKGKGDGRWMMTKPFKTLQEAEQARNHLRSIGIKRLAIIED